MRLALGVAVLFPIVLARREVLPRSVRMWAHIAVAALCANAVPYPLFAVAGQTVGSSMAGIINATTALWTVLLALAARYQKSVTSWQAGRLIVGFRGSTADFSPWGSSSSVASAGGLVILGIIGTGIAYMLNYQRITSEGATIASPSLTCCLWSIALGVLVLGEDITAMVIAGIALIRADVALTRRHPKAAGELGRICGEPDKPGSDA